jgi:hypothetical protein
LSDVSQVSRLNRYRIKVQRKSWPCTTWLTIEAMSERDASYRVTRVDGDVVKILDIQRECEC